MLPLQWIEEKLELNPKEDIRFAKLYSDYRSDTIEHGLVPLGPKRFSRLLRHTFESEQRDGKVTFENRSGLIIFGLSLKQNQDILYDKFSSTSKLATAPYAKASY